jgi:hypothetical protein
MPYESEENGSTLDPSHVGADDLRSVSFAKVVPSIALWRFRIVSLVFLASWRWIGAALPRLQATEAEAFSKLLSSTVAARSRGFLTALAPVIGVRI